MARTYVLSGNDRIEIGNYSGDLYENTRFYTLREYDKETGLYFYRARYYSPELGRFVLRDPIDVEDGVNLYNYVGGNPVNATDPTGLEKKFIRNHDATYLFLKYLKSSKKQLKNNPFSFLKYYNRSTSGEWATEGSELGSVNGISEGVSDGAGDGSGSWNLKNNEEFKKIAFIDEDGVEKIMMNSN